MSESSFVKELRAQNVAWEARQIALHEIQLRVDMIRAAENGDTHIKVGRNSLRSMAARSLVAKEEGLSLNFNDPESTYLQW